MINCQIEDLYTDTDEVYHLLGLEIIDIVWSLLDAGK